MNIKNAPGDGVPWGEPVISGSLSDIFPDKERFDYNPLDAKMKIVMLDVTGLEEPIRLPKAVEELIRGTDEIARADSLLFIAKDGGVVEFVRADLVLAGAQVDRGGRGDPPLQGE